MRRDLFLPTAEGEGRLLLLINAFSRTANAALEGRTKLAKLDFLLRYPSYLERALHIRRPDLATSQTTSASPGDIETRMVRYRYGPWDPAYFMLLGRLIGRGLVTVKYIPGGLGFAATDKGKQLASTLAKNEEWQPIAERAALLKRHFDLSGTRLKNFIYENFPEVTNATWGEPL